MSGSKTKSDQELELEESLRAESFYSIGSCLPEETISCVSVLSEYDQEALEKTFSGIDGNDPLSGESMVMISAPWGQVSEDDRKEFLDTLTKYRDPEPIESSDSASEGERDPLDDDHPDLPDTSFSGSGGSRPLSPLILSDDDYTEYVDIPVPDALQKVELRTPLITLLRDVVGVMVNARDEPLYSLQRYDVKNGDIRLVRKGRLYKYSAKAGSTPILESPEIPAGKKDSDSGTGPEAVASSSKVPPHVRTNGSTDVVTTDRTSNRAKGSVLDESTRTQPRAPTPGDDSDDMELPGTKLPTFERAFSPAFSNHYAQTSSTEEESDEEEEFEVEQETYTFICPVLESDEASVKKFPGAEVEPLIKSGMAPPEIFRALLSDRGVLRAMEAVLDIDQTHMS